MLIIPIRIKLMKARFLPATPRRHKSFFSFVELFLESVKYRIVHPCNADSCLPPSQMSANTSRRRTLCAVSGETALTASTVCSAQVLQSYCSLESSSTIIALSRRLSASVITLKPAIHDHFKTGQGSRTQNMKLFYLADASSGKFC
jgi:hypothetical protein